MDGDAYAYPPPTFYGLLLAYREILKNSDPSLLETLDTCLQKMEANPASWMNKPAHHFDSDTFTTLVQKLLCRDEGEEQHESLKLEAAYLVGGAMDATNIKTAQRIYPVLCGCTLLLSRSTEPPTPQISEAVTLAASPSLSVQLSDPENFRSWLQEKASLERYPAQMLVEALAEPRSRLFPKITTALELTSWLSVLATAGTTQNILYNQMCGILGNDRKAASVACDAIVSACTEIAQQMQQRGDKLVHDELGRNV